jgi:hypothetical protein
MPPPRRLLRPRLTALPLSLLLTLATTAAHAEIIELTWSPDNTSKHTGTVAAQKFVEVCGKLGEGENISWQLTSTHAVNFNIHHHVGKQVIYAENRKAIREGGGTLQVKSAQSYCWMWKNVSDTPAQVELALSRRVGN